MFSIYPRSPFDITVIALMVLTVLFYITTTITKIWECVPRAKIWDTSIPGHCIDTYMLLNVSGIFNTVTDFIIVMLPLGRVWTLNMKLKKKAYVVLAFTFGMCAPAFSLVGSIVRLRSTNNPDKTWVQPEIVMWGLAELTTGILCVSFPELGVLLRGRMRRPGVEASTGVRNGRYRQQDAGFHNLRPRLLIWTPRTAPTASTLRRAGGWGGTTTVGSAGADGGGRLHQYVELDGVNLIHHPAAAVTVESRIMQQHCGRCLGDMEAMRVVKVNSDTIV
ncbi:hypothetical protein INS49_004087 [Diaporthe citri]|uniref:uncharacterized protein n=1 Tax=Diaporthe citri TaxID=83186 RepID=UPI001C80FC3E|nr:uncharacterized protein INS49_004087 [Diaporthe citri]KAG6355006.1 hypothetical protein INS49_004087 [Diaporthe citri]